jgi:hypothetical protein
MSTEITTIVENEVRNELIYPSIPMDGIYVETGVFLGGNIARVQEHVDDIKSNVTVIGVDDFSFSNISREHFMFVHLPPNLKSYKELVQQNINPKIQLRSGNSIDVMSQFDNESIDVIFIDDNHEYGHVKNLLSVVLPKMKKGGIIIGHDWNDDGVSQAVKEFFGRMPDKISSSNGGYLYYL